MGERPRTDITALLNAWTGGAPGALDQVVDAVYPELHRIASRCLHGKQQSPTLQCTALINEAYLRMAKSPAKQWSDRTHFFAFAARLTRAPA